MECIRLICVYMILLPGKAQISPSFLVAVPSEIQLGVPTSLSVTVLIDSPVSVTAEVFSDNTSVVKTQGTFKKGLTGIQTLPSILDSAASPPPPYTLVVNGYVGKMLVFSNTTIMQIKALSFTTFIQTDKSRYEPGQAVKIRAISIYSDGKPYKGPADITIKDPKGNLVQRWQLVESYLGVATREFQLSENPRPGMWTILVTVNEVIKRNFMVEHYVQPKFEVLVNVPSIIHYEDNLIGKVNAQYPNGNPVHGVMTVMAEIFNGMSANKTKKISGSADFVFSKDDFTHHFGLFKRSVKPKEGDDMVVINVIAWVTETLTGLKYSRKTIVKVVFQKYHLEFFNYPRVLRTSLNFTAQLKVLLYNQSTLTPMDRMNNITIDMRQMEDNGRKESRVQLSLPVPEDGIIDLSFPVLDQVSMLVLQAEFQNNAVFLELMRHYTSPSSSYIQINRSSSPAHVGIPLWFTAESSYPLSEFHYLVTARGTIVASGTVTSMSFSLTPEDSWAPLAHLVIYSIRSDGEIVNDAIFLHVNQLQRNKVFLSWSEANVKPGEEVSLTVTVSEPESLVGIQVVDNTRNCPELCNSLTEEEVLEGLIGDNMDEDSLPLKSGDPFSIFTTCNIIVLTDARLPRSEVKRPVAEEEMEDESKGVDEDWEPGACRDWIWLEKNMSTTTAKLSFSVPDHITSWHASAFVVSDNLGLGLMSTPAKLTVSQKMFVSLDLPHYIIRGEQLVLEVQLCHNFEKDLKAVVFVVDSDSFEFVYADNQSAHSGMPRNLFVQSGNCATTLFPIRPKDLGTMSVTVKAVSFFGSDTVTSTVLVKSEGIEKSFIKSLFLELVPFADNHSRDITFTFPPDVVPGSQRAEVAAVGNILGPTLSGLESLIQMPYGCGEQNMIHFAPNIYVLKFLTVTGQVEDEIYNRAISFMTTGYQNELSYQRDDGSFSAFGDNDAFGSTWLSAFVLRCFLQARQFITIDANVLSQTAAWLVKQQRPDGAFNEPGRVIHTELQGGQDRSRNISLTAYVLMALLEDQTNKDLYADTVTNALLFLESKLTEGIASNYSLCLVSYALSLSLRVSAQTALKELLKRADIIDGVVFWSLPGGGLKDSWQPRSAYIEMVAYALLSLHTQAKVVEGIPLMKWLSEQRNQLGGYGSTQDTVIALQALSRYAHFSGSDAIDLRITVSTMDSYTLAMFNINSENTLLVQTQEIETGNDIRLTVALEGRGFALFQLNVFYNLDGRKVSQPRSGHEDAEAFDLDIDVVEEDLDHISLTICTQLRDGLHIIQTGMALVEVSMLSGFTAVEDGIQINDIVRKVETPPGKVVLYLDSLTTARVCFNIPAVRDFKVAKVQNGRVVICDYYEPRRKVEREYNSEMMRRTSICAFCGEDCSKCREEATSGGVSVSRLPQDNICSLAWALLILAAVGR